MSGETKRAVMSVLFDTRSIGGDTRRHKKRFKNLLSDLSKVCRGEETQDTMLDWILQILPLEHLPDFSEMRTAGAPIVLQ